MPPWLGWLRAVCVLFVIGFACFALCLKVMLQPHPKRLMHHHVQLPCHSSATSEAHTCLGLPPCGHVQLAVGSTTVSPLQTEVVQLFSALLALASARGL